MPVPWMQGALKGWTKKRKLRLVTTTDLPGGKTGFSASDVSYPANLQPVPANQVDRKPQGERSWKWWSIIIKDKTVFFENDTLLVDDYGKQYKIQSGSDWRESGFTKYQAVEDYTGGV